ncbi:MAG: hypothetical protein MSA61_08120 [Coriobacteriaceae bacterium]|nr:hypothetical protein [Coriobacteriaceae bacterium]
MTGGAYFPCNAGFCETTVARQVTRRLGDAGFHAYVRLLCLLLNEGGGRLPLSLPEEWEDLAERVGLDGDATGELVALMQRYGALTRGDGYVYSPLVSESLAQFEEAREARARGARASAEVRRRKRDAKQSAEQNAEQK